MEKKKETREQLQKRIERAIIHVDRTKETKEVYFADRGLRLTVNEDVAIVATNFHQHIFQGYTSSGVSRPYLYTKALVDIALKNDCLTKDGYSFKKLMDVVKAKDDKMEYNITFYMDWWLMNIFAPLYAIGEKESDTFIVYENYLYNIATQEVVLEEKTEDMTNKQFHEKVLALMDEFTKDIDERVIFKKKTDDELIQENINALGEMENEQILGDNGNV